MSVTTLGATVLASRMRVTGECCGFVQSATERSEDRFEFVYELEFDGDGVLDRLR